MARYAFITVIACGIVAFALAGWTIKGARKLTGSGRRRSNRPAIA